MNEVIARTRFIFGEDLHTAMIEMHSLVGRLEVGDPAAANLIMMRFENMLPILHMTQRMPTLPWSIEPAGRIASG